jgi:hypothetical protein
MLHKPTTRYEIRTTQRHKSTDAPIDTALHIMVALNPGLNEYLIIDPCSCEPKAHPGGPSNDLCPTPRKGRPNLHNGMVRLKKSGSLHKPQT